jgi:hypothetical protein
MKVAYILAGGLLCALSWQAGAADVSPDSASAPTQATMDAQGPSTSGGAMSGGPAMSGAKTRNDTYQELLRSQRSGEQQRMQEFYKGGS